MRICQILKQIFSDGTLFKAACAALEEFAIHSAARPPVALQNQTQPELLLAIEF